ncbi:MAG: hypothetical protein WD847_14110 [Pirellulales bacterium]
MEKFPDDAELLFRLGTTQLQQGQAAEAAGTFKRLLILAVAYEGIGDLGAAAQARGMDEEGA